MSYVVLLRFNGQKVRALSLGSSQEELQETTVIDLKKKCIEEIPGGPDITRLRLIYDCKPLVDDLTLGFYRIRHRDIIVCVIRMPGGGETQGADSTLHRSDFYERLPPNM